MADVDAHSSSDLDPAYSDGELTSGDFGEVSDEGDAAFCSANETLKDIPCNEVINTAVETSFHEDVQLRQKKATSTVGSYSSLNGEDELFNVSNISNGNDDISIVGILGKDHGIAEARLAARRQARAEARDIRMRELERQQKEQEENADRAYYMQSEPLQRSTRVSGSGPAAIARLSSTTSASGTPNAHSSRRSSQDSVEELGSIRDIRHELKEVEEKFRKAMILNAQLDNDKASFSYQLELLKDKLEDLQEQYTQLQREHKDKCRSHEALVRECRVTKEEVERCTAAVALRDRCILEAGFELVAVQLAEGDTEGAGAALVSRASKEALEAAGHGALDVRLQTLCSQRQALESEVKQLKIQLDEERSKKKNNIHNNSSHNGPVNGSDSDSDSMENHRENSKLVADYKFRASKAEQDVLTLQATVARLESQVIRYKSAVEEAERMEDELKCDRRKLQREAREAQSRVEELETENNHLNKRLDKLKTAKSALLKEL